MKNQPSDDRTPLPYAPPGPVRPWWVAVGLFGVSGRSSAWVFVWLSVAMAVISFVIGFIAPIWFLGVGMLVSAWLYWAAIRWVDQNDTWD